MDNQRNKFDLIVKLFFLISIILLFSGFFYLYREQRGIASDIRDIQVPSIRMEPFVGGDLEDNNILQKDEIERLVAEAIATLSAQPSEKVVEKTTVVTEPTGTTYIPMGATSTTTSTSWVDVDESAVYVDKENDYGKDATVSWEASLKVAHGNGQAFARLYDDTNKIAVDFSEISTTDNVDFMQVSSGNLPFWKGRNLYKVQIKSLNSFEVTYSGGKIKISY